jgi:hypothetical protein
MSSVHRPKNNYHPIFAMLYMLKLLPHEVAIKIPSSTRSDWQHKDLEKCTRAEHCTLYTKQFEDIATAHKYIYTRYTLCIALAVIKTLIDITDNSLLYKKTTAHKS